ncbi:hypothetical protein [Clostridium sp.]|uniref:hypothetical protein n=1 Tax=Clostridium sp. TaxID=1506 RepID=UPI001A3EB88C|nr:hypothetical protein [Clostridium sp.]MBK5242684.1 toll/interleukin-1 receptor domain-containing protein [Clostridium sp.]
MFSGFNIKFDESFIYLLDEWYDSKQKINNYTVKYDKIKKEIEQELELYIGVDGVIQGTELQDKWFSAIKGDVFISHSHNDKENVIRLAAWLEDTFKIDVFIDSLVWGSADNLLKKIDDKYCVSDINKDSYDYKKRNYSTSHVHTMLTVALSKMIDRTECIFFINTPESLSISECMESTTSPWLYYELFISQVIRNRELSEYRKEILKEAVIHKEFSQLKVKYNITLDHLKDINFNDICEWRKTKYINYCYSLDGLYEIKNMLPIK